MVISKIFRIFAKYRLIIKIMKIDLSDANFARSIVRPGMAYCFNNACQMTDRCFRFIAGKYKSPSQTKGNAVYPDALQDGKCEHFITPRIINAAWGFKSLYREVTSSDLASMRLKVTAFLGGKTAYYRYHRGEKLLSPEQKEAIANLFKEKGYGEPSFDHRKETVDFTSK